jgi:TctA family transporter
VSFFCASWVPIQQQRHHVRVWTMLLFGILVCFREDQVPVVPFLIGFILGDRPGKIFVAIHQGSGRILSVFFSRPSGWVNGASFCLIAGRVCGRG